MTFDDLKKLSFYFCDLKSGEDDCPKKDTCKRYKYIEDIPYEDYKNLGFARLKNICSRTNYELYMKIDEVKSGDEELHNQT